MTKRVSDEEKIAKTIVYSVNDLTLDLELVGEYISELSPSVLYSRLDVVFTSAQNHKLSSYGYTEHEIARMRLG